MVYFCSSWSLLRALWFGSCSNQILWYTYLKAIVNTVLWAAGLKRKGRFKTTIKTGDMLLGLPLSWPHDLAPACMCAARTWARVRACPGHGMNQQLRAC